MNGLGQLRRMRILVVDDNAEAAHSLKDFLEHAGYEAVAATQASSVLTVAQTFVPDVAILDIELGIINGYELGQHLRATQGLERCVLIAATGYNEQDAVARSRRAGFGYHFVKPIDVDRLQAVLRDLDSKRLTALEGPHHNG
jgi:CheY-like chemotaxis protein